VVCALAGTGAGQSSSDTMSVESSEKSNVSVKQSLDTRFCVLCSQHGDSPSDPSVRLYLLSVI